MDKIKELEVLEKYLSEDELKEVAKKVAYDAFKSNIGQQNPHRKSNIEYYLKLASSNVVRDSLSEEEMVELTSAMKEKTLKVIEMLSAHDLPNNYRDVAHEAIESNSQIIKDKVHDIVKDFVNGDNFDSLYENVASYIGDRFTDILHECLEKKFKKEY